jgi:type IV pilus assembly protein PilW
MRTPSMMMPSEGQRGFSLVELMVAMTIGLIVLAGIGYMYIESRRSFTSMDNLSRMQENGRYALEIMARDIRMAGYRGCSSSSGAFYNTLNNSTDSAYNFGVPINGYQASGGSWSPALPSSGVGALSGLSILAGTDAITLRSAFGSGTTVTKQPGNNSSSDLQITTPNDLLIGDIAIVTNCVASTVFQVTNKNINGTNQNVVHNQGTGTPGNATNNLGVNYSDSGGELLRMQTRTYFIRTGASGRPALWQVTGANAAQEIADGIENMQIQYGLDTTGDGVVDGSSYVTADAVTDWTQVAAVRISLLMVGTDDNTATSNQTYNYNGAAVTAGDMKLRQVFTATVSVRNRTQ